MNTTFSKLKTKALKDPAVRAEYDALAPEYEVIQRIISYRQAKGFSQTELAKRAGTRQPVISRLERGGSNPTLDLLQRIARALDTDLIVSMR